MRPGQILINVAEKYARFDFGPEHFNFKDGFRGAVDLPDGPSEDQIVDITPDKIAVGTKSSGVMFEIDRRTAYLINLVKPRSPIQCVVLRNEPQFYTGGATSGALGR
jgi:hypothetical protein